MSNVQPSYPLGAVTVREYDAVDRVIAETDPLGRRTTAGYDAAGRPTWQQDPDGRLSATASAGNPLVQLQRDAANRCVRITDATRGDGRTAHTDANGRRTRWQRDAAGRVSAAQHPVFGTVNYAYDVFGNLVGAVAGDLVQYWDYRGGVLAAHRIAGPDGVETSTLERDEDGRTAIHDGSGTTAYAYDAACQLVRMSGADGTVTEWRYDAAGRLARETVDGQTRDYEYDAAGQLRVRSTDDTATTYDYDGAGRRTAAHAQDGTTRYQWSAMGTLREVERTAATGTTRHELWVDALSELAEVDGTGLWWDTAEYAPRVLSVGGHSVTAMPGGVAAVNGTLLSAGWRGEHPTAAANPWALAGQSLPACLRAWPPTAASRSPGWTGWARAPTTRPLVASCPWTRWNR